MLTKLLKKIDFDEKESSIYLTCLKNKLNTPASLTQQTGIKRSTVYCYVDKLKEKGLLFCKIKNKKKYIVAFDPEYALENLIEKQEEQLRKEKKIIGKLIPQLEKIIQKPAEKTQINYCENDKRLKIFINSVLKTKKNLHWIGTMDVFLETMKEDEFYRLFTLERLKQGTSSYAITDKEILKKKRFSEEIGNFRYFRFLSQKIELKSVIAIYGDNIAILSRSNNRLKVVLIEDSEMSEMLHFTFRLLWDILPEC